MSSREIIYCGGTRPRRSGHVKATDLAVHGPGANVTLKVGDLSAKVAANIPPALIDLLELAAYVYAADQACGRGAPDDTGEKWRRQFRFHVPVRVPEVWAREDVRTALEDALAFLSDDSYEFTFSRIQRAPPVQGYLSGVGPAYEVDEVMLFSGGLDSFAGALHEVLGEGKRVALVSHSSATKRMPIVNELVQEIRRRSGRPVAHVPVVATKAEKIRKEYTQRTRSFLYASLATTVAVALGRRRIRFYENGVTSMNLPISPQVVGGRATRTTHPQVVRLLTKLFSTLLGEPFAVETPFFWKTKTDVLRLIREHDYGDLIATTVSCASTIQSSREHPHCGRCSQCIDRRLAAIAAKVSDSEDPPSAYKVDLLTGPHAVGESRAMVEGFVQRARLLESCGPDGFLALFPEAARALRHLTGSADEAVRRLAEMHRRHAQDVLTAIMIGRELHSSALAAGTLPDSSLLAIANSGRYRANSSEERSVGPTLAKRGDFWSVWFAGEETTIKHGRPIELLARILQEPHRVWSALELSAGGDGVLIERPADAHTDDTSLRAYVRRLEELDEEIELARENGAPERALELAEEKAKLAKHVRSITGLHGKRRLAADAQERARKAVGNALGRGLKQLRKNHPALSRHLETSLRLGATVVYQPTPPIEWRIAA